MAKKRNPHPPLKPHTEGEYMEEVVVVRVPRGTAPEQARKAVREAKSMAEAISYSRRNHWNEYYQRKRKSSW